MVGFRLEDRDQILVPLGDGDGVGCDESFSFE